MSTRVFGQWEIEPVGWRIPPGSIGQPSSDLPCCPAPVTTSGKIAPSMPTYPCRPCFACPAISIQCPDGSYTGYRSTSQGCKLNPCSPTKRYPPIIERPLNALSFLSQVNQNVLYIAIGAVIYLLWVKR